METEYSKKMNEIISDYNDKKNLAVLAENFIDVKYAVEKLIRNIREEFIQEVKNRVGTLQDGYEVEYTQNSIFYDRHLSECYGMCYTIKYNNQIQPIDGQNNPTFIIDGNKSHVEEGVNKTNAILIKKHKTESWNKLVEDAVEQVNRNIKRAIESNKQ